MSIFVFGRSHLCWFKNGPFNRQELIVKIVRIVFFSLERGWEFHMKVMPLPLSNKSQDSKQRKFDFLVLSKDHGEFFLFFFIISVFDVVMVDLALKTNLHFH